MIEKLLASVVFTLLLSTSVYAISATISIPEQYSEVDAGENIFFLTEIKWPENNVRQDLRLEYSIQDSLGQEVAYLKTLKAVETQASFIDSVTVPPSTTSGLYRVKLILSDYTDLSEEVVVSFRVRAMETTLFSTMNIILFIVSFIALAIVIELFMIMKKMD